MMLRMRMLPKVLPVGTCRQCPRGIEPRPNCLRKSEGEGGYNYEVSCDGRFQPPNTLLKQGGLQLAEVSFREMLNCLLPQPNNMQPETVWQVALRSIQSSDLVLAPMLCDHWNEDAESAPAKTSWAGWRQPQYNKFSGISSPVTFGEEVTSLNRSVGKRLL